MNTKLIAEEIGNIRKAILQEIMGTEHHQFNECEAWEDTDGDLVVRTFDGDQITIGPDDTVCLYEFLKELMNR